MISNKYIFEVTIKAFDSNLHSFFTVGENIAEVHYNFNDKVYNGQPIEIIKVEREDKTVEGYTSNLELNPDYKPTKDNSKDDEIVL